MDGFVCLTPTRRMEVKRGMLEFTTKLMDESKLMDSNIGLEDKKEHARNILKRAWGMVAARRQKFVEPDRKWGAEGYISKTKESLKSLIGVGYYNENEAANYTSIAWDNLKVSTLLEKWDITYEKFSKMVNEYKNDGISVVFAHQIVLQIDYLFGSNGH